MSVEEIKSRLLQDVEDNNAASFYTNYQTFLKKFSDFNRSLSAQETTVPVTSAIFGKPGFYLKPTTDEQAEKILTEGRKASRVFGALPLEDRLEFLKILEAKIEAHKDEIMLTFTADTGKPIDLSAGEMTKGKAWFEYAEKEAPKQLAPMLAGGGNVKTDFHPLGVAQIIGAYNYPYALSIGGIVGALTTGNSVVVSSPLKSPNWVFPFMQAAQEASQEFAEKAKAEGKTWAAKFAEVAPNLITHSLGVNTNLTKESDVVHFVGSNYTGEIIRHARAGRKIIREMGGSNVVTVMASATTNEQDIKSVADKIYNGFGPSTGQRCTAPRVLCIQEGAEGVVTQLSAMCDEVAPNTVGNPFKKGVKMGPLVDDNAYKKMQESIAIAKELGATVHGTLDVSENEVLAARNRDAHWVNPVIIDWTKAMESSDPDKVKKVYDCMDGEIFGPLLHIVHPVKDLDSAIEMTNKLDSHKLAGAIFTRNPEEAERYQHETQAGSIAVNEAPKDQTPWGIHGHPGMDVIGGGHHFQLYSHPRTLAGKMGLAI